jgi:hypothetical protein
MYSWRGKVPVNMKVGQDMGLQQESTGFPEASTYNSVKGTV